MQHSLPLQHVTKACQSVPNFTDLTVRSLPEGLHFDARTPGFGIRIGKQRKTWLIVKQPNRTKVRLGHYPDLTLADARRKALVALGSPLTPKTAPPFPEALESFLAQDRWKASTKKMLEWSLRRHFTWRKPLDKITHEDLAQVLDGIEAPSERAHAYANVRIFFNWCIPRYLSASPCVGYEAPSPQSRARVLTDEELKRVWIAADAIGYPFGTIVKLLILTGQRRGEIAALQWDWISDTQISMPGTITKNGREHTFPLSVSAATILKKMKQAPHTLLLFSAKGQSAKSYSGFSKSKKQLDKLSKVDDWTLHDLRRSFATGLASLGVPIHITERLLNHISGTSGGLIGVYQRHEYWDEQVAAMTAWENRVLSIVRAG